MLAPQAGNAGSNPARVNEYTTKWCNWQTRGAQNAVPISGLGVQLSSWSLQVGRRTTDSHKAGLPGSSPGPATVNRQRRWARPSGASYAPTVRCDTWTGHFGARGKRRQEGRVRKHRQSGQVESLVNLWVQLPPRSLLCGPVVQWHDNSPTCWRRWFNSIRDQSMVCRCCGSTPPW